VEEFSSRKFTYIEDRVPAIAALTGYFSDLTLDTPLLGMWHRNLIWYLLWFPCLDNPPIVEQIKDLPSWTWLSWPMRVIYKLPEAPADLGPLPTGSFWELDCSWGPAKVIKASITWSHTPLTSIPTAIMILESYVIELDFSEHHLNSPAGNGIYIASLHLRPDYRFLYGVVIVHDYSPVASEAAVLFCMVYSKYCGQKFSHGLVLLPVESSAGT
jgi:hypothetical protein